VGLGIFFLILFGFSTLSKLPLRPNRLPLGSVDGISDEESEKYRKFFDKASCVVQGGAAWESPQRWILRE
jgi:hypothetical protein